MLLLINRSAWRLLLLLIFRGMEASVRISEDYSQTGNEGSWSISVNSTHTHTHTFLTCYRYTPSPQLHYTRHKRRTLSKSWACPDKKTKLHSQDCQDCRLHRGPVNSITVQNVQTSTSKSRRFIISNIQEPRMFVLSQSSLFPAVLFTV